MTLVWDLVVGVFLGCLVVLAAFGVRAALACVRARLRPAATPSFDLDAFPIVTFQVPLCDEGELVVGAVAAIAAVDYPRDRFEIQLCDDSTDPRSIAACVRVAEDHRARGVRVTRLERPVRRDWKAGNLNHALASARGEYVAIVDPDFRIPADLLRRTLPILCRDPSVAAVQTHFVHANADANLLTRAFAAVYDFHLRIEQLTRSNWDLWMEFMGSAGIWRRSAIEDCGGWPRGTGTEDVHLSFLAQCRGWRIRFSTATTSIGMLPETPEAFRRQQVRWAVSMGWLTRRLGWRMLTARARLAARLTGVFHLMAYLVYVAMAGVMLLSWPVLRWTMAAPGREWVGWAAAGALGCSVALSSLATCEGDRRAGRGPGAALGVGLLLTFISAGISVLAARAYLAGLLGAPVRSWRPSGAVPPRRSRPGVDLVLEVVAVTSAGMAAVEGFGHGCYLMPLPGLLFGACTLAFLTMPLWLRFTQRPAAAVPAEQFHGPVA